MPVIKQTGQKDGAMFRDSMKEFSGAFEEQVLLKQWTGTTGGNPQRGVMATDTWKNVHVRANISDLQASEIFYPAADYVAGDLMIELRVQVFGAIAANGEDGKTAGRKSDQVIYRGRTYYFVGHIHRLQNAGRIYWAGHMRPVGT